MKARRTCTRACAPTTRSGSTGRCVPDHVPALEGETNDSFGYTNLGRLFAIGYIAGLREAAYGRPATEYRPAGRPA